MSAGWCSLIFAKTCMVLWFMWDGLSPKADWKWSGAQGPTPKRFYLNIIGGGGGSSTSSGPVGVEELAARFVDALIGMGTKVVALGLQQVGGQAFTAVAIEIVEGGGNGGSGDAVHYSGGHYTAPAFLSLVHHILKEGIEQEVGQVFVLVEGFLDFA